MSSKYRIYSLLMLIFTLVSFSSCDEDEAESQVAISLKGITSETTMYSGDVLEISIYTVAPNSSLTRFVIESYDSRNGNSTLLDKALSGSSADFKYYYKAPQIQDQEQTVRLSFSSYDDTGYVRTISREIKVKRREEALEERSGVILYCDEDNAMHADGYCLSEMRPVIVSLVGPELVDLYIPSVEYPELQADMPTVVREWRTKTDINFARANSFDFSNANSINISTAYEASIRAPKITNLNSGEIVIVGRGAKPVAAIQIVDIIVGEYLNQSRYILNIKAIKSNLPYTPDTPKNPEDNSNPK